MEEQDLSITEPLQLHTVLRPCLRQEDYHENVIKYMTLARRCGQAYARNNKRHRDECVAEAYYLLVLQIIKHSQRPVDEGFEIEKQLLYAIFKGLSSYFRSMRPVNITDVLTDDWMYLYGEMTHYVPVEQHLEELLENLTQSDTELAVLIMTSHGYEQKEIGERLDMDKNHVNKIITRIRARLWGETYRINEGVSEGKK